MSYGIPANKLPIPPKSELERLYVDEETSMEKMGAVLGVSRRTITRWLIKYGIELRPCNQYVYEDLRKIPLSTEQRDLIVGSTLGDGCLFIANRGKNARFGETHAESQLGYLKWKRDILSPFIQQEMVVREPEVIEILGTKCNIQRSTRLQTIVHPEFTEFRKIFYDENGKKRIPENLVDYLNDFVLAVWFMDDGNLYWNSNTGTYSLVLCTQSFSYYDHLIMKDVLQNYFNIDIKLRKSQGFKNTQYYVAFSGKSAIKNLCDRLYSYAVDCMKYKFITPQ